MLERSTSMSGDRRESMDLTRPGVVWLDARPVPVALAPSDRPVARLVPARGTGWGRTAALEIGVPDRVEPRPGALSVGGRTRQDRLGAIDRWYRREARSRIEAAVERESERLGLFPARVTIRDQRTRWGSCSTTGTLSFNWRLVIGPVEALDYVVVHELVHLLHHDHSRRFWGALTTAMPDWKARAAWLRANERTLTAWRPVV
jgi:predicted metal-dependent hydrolase